MTEAPEIAVVIPTRNREQRVAAALNALALQTLVTERFEVFVVRDDSQPGPFAAPPDDLMVRYLTHPGTSGPTAKRNLGWRAATAPLIAFTDDDCRPAQDWLERLIEVWDDGSFLQGRTEADPDEVHLFRGLARSRIVVGPSPWFPGCNIAYPRSLLERIHGFDESFYFGGEDTDLALRAQQAGATARYVNDALVWHAVLSRTMREAVREAFAWPSFALLVARHPSQRRHLYLRLFRNKSHAALVLAMLGIAAARHRPILAWAAFYPYVHHKMREALPGLRPTPRTLTRLGLNFSTHLVLETIEVAATVRSAVRYRVPVA